MREYKRPVVLVNEELAEGVYAASGDVSFDIVEAYVARMYIDEAEDGQKVLIILKDGTSREAVYSKEEGIGITAEEVQIGVARAVLL